MNRSVQLLVIGMDIVKNVFQIHAVDVEAGGIEHAKLKRNQIAKFLPIAIAAHDGPYYWVCTLKTLGQGARAPITQSKRSAWLQSLLARYPISVVVATLVNRMARTIWAVPAKGIAFDQVKWNSAESGRHLFKTVSEGAC